MKRYNNLCIFIYVYVHSTCESFTSLYIYFNFSTFFFAFSFPTNIVSIWLTIYFVILSCAVPEISGRKISMSLMCNPNQQHGHRMHTPSLQRSSTWSTQFKSPFSILSPLTATQSSFGFSPSVSSFTIPSFSSSWKVINPFARNHKDMRIRHIHHPTHRRLFSPIRVPHVQHHHSDHKQNLCKMIQHLPVSNPAAASNSVNSQSLANIFKHNHVNTFVNLVLQPYDSKDPRIMGKKYRLNKVFSFKDSFWCVIIVGGQGFLCVCVRLILCLMCGNFNAKYRKTMVYNKTPPIRMKLMYIQWGSLVCNLNPFY